MKQCVKCKEIKELDCFYIDRGRRVARCKTCVSEDGKRYKKQKRDYSRRYNKENRDKINKRRRERLDTVDGKIKQYIIGAKRRDLEFLLDIDIFSELVRSRCYYCDGYESNRVLVGLDRIDSNGNYTVDNCVPCCEMCNRMKMGFSSEDFFDKVFRIYEKHHEQKQKKKTTKYP